MSKKKKGKLRVTSHALSRLRTRWPGLRSETNEDLTHQLRKRIAKALKRGQLVNAPGGTYVLISFEGEDGYAVLKNNNKTMVTMMPKGWCPEVNKVIGDNTQ